MTTTSHSSRRASRQNHRRQRTSRTANRDTNPFRGQIGRDIAQAFESSLDMVGALLGNVDRLVEGVRRDSQQIARDSEALYRAAVGRFGDLRDSVSATPRFARIVREGLAIISRYRVEQARARYATAEDAARRLEAAHQQAARRLYRLCVEMRGAVLKLGQFLSCRMDLLPSAYIDQLSALQDRVPPIAFEAIAERIENELGKPLHELFRPADSDSDGEHDSDSDGEHDSDGDGERRADIDREPIAAASLAQVHRARLPDGRTVALKVQVPGIEDIVQADLLALRILAGAAGDLVPHLDLTAICDELARSIRQELDFLAEADNLRHFAAAFADDDSVVIPAVIPECSSRRVLAMELIEGERLTEFLDRQDADDPAAKDRALAIMLRAFCQQILQDGVFHADPHPGNFLVQGGPRLAFLDFGCVARLRPEARRAYAAVASAFLTGDTEAMAERLGEMGFRTRSGDSGSLIELAEMMLEAFREGAARGVSGNSSGASPFAAIDPRAQLERVMAIARDNPVVEVPREFVLLGRVFATLAGLLVRYQPRIDLFAIIAPFLSRALAETD